MSVKKYRFYLLMLTLVIVIAGMLSYFYFVEQDKTYKDGTLVLNECMLEEFV